SVLSVSHAGKADVHAMLIGSLGCNLAWGIIDGIMYLMNSLATRSSELDALRAIRAAKDSDEAQRMLAAACRQNSRQSSIPGNSNPCFDVFARCPGLRPNRGSAAMIGSALLASSAWSSFPRCRS